MSFDRKHLASPHHEGYTAYVLFRPYLPLCDRTRLRVTLEKAILAFRQITNDTDSVLKALFKQILRHFFSRVQLRQ
ncbi:hypothetical protein J6590_089551 [Homalodisca vitripennis]|nr:hypothetical protein J6590_089551 [Homalodisca vitripennis]